MMEKGSDVMHMPCVNNQQPTPSTVLPIPFSGRIDDDP
jgi:hypothetical protein